LIDVNDTEILIFKALENLNLNKYIGEIIFYTPKSLNSCSIREFCRKQNVLMDYLKLSKYTT